ncbi:MAG: hypothetical protein Q7R81_04380 [Candidatus Peregrinibacteria bacterium]|nr:hypothetical protein [Candidatus Peregrinibacteria bacterium]
MHILPYVILGLLVPSAAYADSLRIPSYVFTDWRYWVYLALYVLLTAKVVRWALRGRIIRDRLAAVPLEDVSWGAVIIFGNAIVYQIFHHYEHLTQIYQFWYLGLPPKISKGVLFFFDVEWNHFIFDAGYFLMLFAASALLLRKWWQAGHHVDRIGGTFIAGTLLVQGWHAIEHTFRITKHVTIGCEPCPGIADTLLGIRLIPLHFWFNVFALTLPLLVFVWFSMHRKIWYAIRGPANPPQAPMSMRLS